MMTTIRIQWTWDASSFIYHLTVGSARGLWTHPAHLAGSEAVLYNALNILPIRLYVCAQIK